MNADLASSTSPRTRFARVVRIAVLALALLALAGIVLVFCPSAPISVAASSPHSSPSMDAAMQIERGRYLATLGNCQACHTVAGGPAYAGGTPLRTAFGVVYGPNLTPSAQGLGAWTAEDFWRAMHHGQRPDGRWLAPVFPYPNMTQVTREDSDALYAYLRSLRPDARANQAAELSWPFNTQAALKVWRWLYFDELQTPKASSAEPATDSVAASVERGRYLAQGLAHCSACHATRDRWGGASDLLNLQGGQMPSGWYAPSLHATQEAGVQSWREEDVVALLRDGRAGHHGVSGPMAEVVAGSMRRWKDDDLLAVARYLKSLPADDANPEATTQSNRASSQRKALGAKVYEKHCAACHGERGLGFVLKNGQVAYPALAGNRTVTMNSPVNLAHIVMEGGFGVVSAREPRPFGMPPFVQTLSDAELAALFTYLRSSWGNSAPEVSDLDLHRLRDDIAR